ncbi:unnamed protein product [Colias eurytheme]|nr:unnamed protein product [Colias eurytheme]
MKCSGCLKVFKDNNSVKCTLKSCGKIFCQLCINANGLTAEQKNKWECPICSSAQKRGGDNSNTPVRSTSDSQFITMRKKDSSITEVTGNDVKELTSEIRRLTQEFSSIKQRLEDATQSLIICNERIEMLEGKVTANESRIKILECNNREINVLKATISNLQSDLNLQAQQHLRNEIELAGIPETAYENLHHIALLASRKVGVELSDQDIDWVMRAGPRISKEKSTTSHKGKLPRPVVIRFHRRSKRDEILKSAKSRKNINSADLNIPGEASKIYYNERLTKENRLLFREARSKYKLFGYAFCWCSNGNVYVRQREGKNAIHIRTQNDLHSIFNSAPHIDDTSQC